jgi:Fe2+ transport system protein FeoA
MTSGIPLGLMRDGSSVCVRDIVASERVKCQLFEQGLVPGSSLSIVKTISGDL